MLDAKLISDSEFESIKAKIVSGLSLGQPPTRRGRAPHPPAPQPAARHPRRGYPSRYAK